MNSVTSSFRCSSTPGWRRRGRSPRAVSRSTTSQTPLSPNSPGATPHVFGDVAVSGAAEVHRNWEAIKRAERNARAPGGSGVGGGEDDGEPSRAAELAGAFERVPAGLPAVSRLSKITGKIAGAGLDVESLMDAAADQVELMDGALGRAVVAAVRAGAEPEMALRRYTLALQAAALDAARNGTAENAGGGAEA